MANRYFAYQSLKKTHVEYIYLTICLSFDVLEYSNDLKRYQLVGIMIYITTAIEITQIFKLIYS